MTIVYRPGTTVAQCLPDEQIIGAFMVCGNTPPGHVLTNDPNNPGKRIAACYDTSVPAQQVTAVCAK